MEQTNLVKAALKGDKTALEQLLSLVQEPIYNLALRMLANPEDAKEATQEILIKLMVNLSSFKSESLFSTWAFRVASNFLLTEKKVLSKYPELSFDQYQQDLEEDLQTPGEMSTRPDYKVLLNELRISCTLAMLLCLKPAYRMAYILGEILGLDHSEASFILGLEKATYRQQLTRARQTITDFTAKSCGLVSQAAQCQCPKKLVGAINKQRVNPEQVIFLDKQQYSYSEVLNSLASTQQELKTLALQKSVRFYKSPIDLAAQLEQLVGERNLKLTILN